MEKTGLEIQKTKRKIVNHKKGEETKWKKNLKRMRPWSAFA